MWNYNIDEMPKDGSEIAVCFRRKNLNNEYVHDFHEIKFIDGMWQNPQTGTIWNSMQNVVCWALAPKDPESESETSELQYTNRGFGYYKFSDYNGHECTLQESSIIADEYCVWLGREKNEEPHLGYELSPRMHLTQSRAKWLGEKLLHFAETGELLDDNQKDNIGHQCSVNNHWEVIGK